MAEAAQRQGNAAVFIDLENLFGGYSKDVGSVPLAPIARQLLSLLHNGNRARATAIRAYANWAQPAMRSYQDDLLAHGIEAVQVFSFTRNVKNAADIQMCVDVLAEAQDRPWTDTFVIVSGDGGFVPLVRRLRQLNKRVIVASTNHAAAGAVNRLLASAADEYHVLEVASPEPAPAKPAAAPGRATGPTLKEYRAEILAAIERNPGMRVKGRVDGSPLGQHLRQKWPSVTFKDFGSATLGAFVEEHCGLAVHRPGAPTAPAAPPEPQRRVSPSTQASAPPSSAEPSDDENRAAYLRAVRALFLSGPLGAVVDARKRLPAAEAGLLVRRHVAGTDFSDVGYSKFAGMLQDALVATPFALDRDERHGYVVHRRSASAAG
ncbi:NYN domain-containing protein [Sinomonas sp. ASV486]|uniref:NYN domain-containing protein n=1 Tax=Sinomonas sp. ASV486 TaxID=3051170 RepID=UPI0027DDC891|nr:NYN domain-containing protein [Sinomonas sp. ASV486]MDQ4488786.1 NYN domain-containing protein [Sinomonas sp. ASV486]